jgi:hypothetical protein
MQLLLIAMLTLFSGLQVPSSPWTAQDQQKAEQKIADKIEAMRRSAGLPPLKRTQPSIVEIQLVCTAALTGKEVHDPRYGGLETYVTDDLNVEKEGLKLVSLGTSQFTGENFRRPVYSDRGWPRFSVVVDIDSTSKPDAIRYRVGVTRRGSAISEFLAPMTYDNPIKDSKDWQDQVVAACRTSPKR